MPGWVYGPRERITAFATLPGHLYAALLNGENSDGFYLLAAIITAVVLFVGIAVSRHWRSLAIANIVLIFNSLLTTNWLWHHFDWVR